MKELCRDKDTDARAEAHEVVASKARAKAKGRGSRSNKGQLATALAAADRERLEGLDLSSLLSWFSTSKRDLPWRSELSPWRVWVSEIMLQQTRASVVIPYFQNFMEAFPTPEALAEAPEDRVLKLWEGLGYYSRARNLQKGARYVEEVHGGRIPATYDEVIRIPGVGDYTAGAILSFVHGLPVPAVDGNVVRVLARLCERPWTQGDTGARKEARAMMEILLNSHPGQSAAINEAMIELGAVICKPRDPQCAGCPLALDCLARAAGTASRLPIPKKDAVRPEDEITVLVLETEDHRFLVSRRPSTGLLGGLWEFPVLDGHRTADEVIRLLDDSDVGPVIRSRPLPSHRHIFSHLVWNMVGFHLTIPGHRYDVPPSSDLDAKKGTPCSDVPELVEFADRSSACWVSREELAGIALAGAIEGFRRAVL